MSLMTRQLNIYTLPQEILSNLAVRTIAELDDPSEAGPSTSTSKSKSHANAKAPALVSQAPAGSLSCQSCPSTLFESVKEQRAHFKSDWHRYNAKARIEGKGVVDAEQWENMVEGVSSISGSASSSSAGSGSSESDKVTKLLKKQNLNAGPGDSVDSDEEAELAHNRRRAMLRTAIIWFTPTQPLIEMGVPQDTQFGMHRFLFPPLDNVHDYLGELRRMQINGTGKEEEGEERRITLLMVAGGHFAGMVVGIKPKGKNEKQDIKGAGEVRVIKSKTFHRYTTRKKQGGSQGLNDNSKSKAISAGAMLRRYGEKALQEEIRALLSDWEEDLGMSEKIFLRASTHGKQSFWGYEGAVLHKSDERIRVFPFPTRRPTIAELLRCWHELTRVKISHLTADALQAQDEAYIASLQPKRPIVKPQAPTPTAPAPVPAVPKLSPEEEAKLDRQKRLVDMVKKGRLDSLRPFITKYPDEITPSILAIAASSAQEEVLSYLLEEVKLDPTVSVEGRKPYDHASTKEIRNIFRRLAFKSPELWDWKAAHVPSGLSEEKEQEEDRKKAERRKGLKDKIRERERVRAEAAAEEEAKNPVKEEATPPPPPVVAPSGTAGGPQKLGGRIGGEGNLAGMTPEMRMKIERERRARAAEARFK